MENAKTLERIRILISLLSGILTGLLNVNQLMGPVVYIIMHALVTGLMVVKVKDTAQYFVKKTDVFSGIGSGVLIFVCAWMIVYNIVYTLWKIRVIWFFVLHFIFYEMFTFKILMFQIKILVFNGQFISMLY